ncbi:MAG: hypothetical protein ACON38_00265 [Akkermansiaceae bacterium]
MKAPSENPDATRSSMASTKADFRELKANSSATVREIQEFLSQLKGKSPQEMLGVVASSQLFRATILSLILVTGGIFALTAVPYFLQEESSAEAESAATEPAKASESAPAKAPEPAPAPGPIPAKPTPGTTPPDTPPEISPLGVNEKLPAPPNKNPLEDKKEDFLKDLE